MQFLNIIFLLALFGAATVSCATVIVPLPSIYASLQSHKIDFNNDFSNLI